MAVKLNVYKKDDLRTPVATGDDDNGATITGLAAGTVVATGDYKATHTDDEGKFEESDLVDVPGFTVKTPEPSNLKATPTSDGAVIKPS